MTKIEKIFTFVSMGFIVILNVFFIKTSFRYTLGETLSQLQVSFPLEAIWVNNSFSRFKVEIQYLPLLANLFLAFFPLLTIKSFLEKRYNRNAFCYFSAIIFTLLLGILLQNYFFPIMKFPFIIYMGIWIGIYTFTIFESVRKMIAKMKILQ